MVRLTTFAFVVAFVIPLFTASVACSQTDVIALYGDSLHTDCHSFMAPMSAAFHVFHYSASGATGCQFRLPNISCGEIEGPMLLQTPYSTSGNVTTGIVVQYGACMTGWIFVAIVAYIDPSGFGFAPCCEQAVLAHPEAASGKVEAFDCTSTPIPVPATGMLGFVNGDQTCPCSTPTGIQDETYSTWGAIKGLYD